MLGFCAEKLPREKGMSFGAMGFCGLGTRKGILMKSARVNVVEDGEAYHHAHWIVSVR